VTQATANDLLRYSLRMLDAEGLDAVLHCHDEIVTECANADVDISIATMNKVMCNPPPWAQGLPLAIEAKAMKRYGK
jgi:DNA polymerase I-like protein with 3'-5' exonuclease and polymerase domains